ncbi:Phosphate acetyltransferase [Fundidesulfovibrio magnetotacticus]|uniref:Phosphate acetyltransferase n=1 Tax=Fundidesulfovibrio magnetotacticus TaxID=2730080 RepID=A0A6V8LRE0_9BACT|nr:DRTGG domain-containing protein [Fundidesulfovibrio magnetotacticus]GFK95053.1 Phosphate acetyltransferase [Fundidesulfovibrio magnetotacticus]
MPGLYIGSTAPYSGKNTLCLGLGLTLRREGHSVGYFKPVGAQAAKIGDAWGDLDARAVCQALGLDTAPELATPVLVTQDFMHKAFSQAPCQDRTKTIAAAYKKVSSGKDVTLVGGSGGFLTSGLYACLDGPTVAQALDLPVLIVDRCAFELNYDILLSIKERLGDRMIGCVLSDVPGHYMEEVSSVLAPFLARRGVKVLGVIPHDRLLNSVTVESLAQRLGATIISGAAKAQDSAESFIIGAMQVENFLTHFRKHPKAAVILGGDRSDLQLVAIEGRPACLILTGNLYPNDIILARAEHAEVPIMVVRDDTYSVAKRMESLIARHKLRDPGKYQQASQLVAAHVDVAAVKKGLGL